MDTKSKNKFKETLIFIVSIYLLLISTVLIKNSIENAEENTTPYFESGSFATRVCEIFNGVAKEPGDSLTTEEFEEVKSKYQSILNNKQKEIEKEYVDRIKLAKEAQDNVLLNALTTERDKKISDVRKENYRTNEQIKQEIIKEKNTKYARNKEELKKKSDFKYYIKNKSTGKIDTNLDDPSKLESAISNSMHYVKLPDGDEMSRYGDINSYCKDNNYEMYFIVPKDISQDSIIYEEYEMYKRNTKHFIQSSIISVIILVITILIFIYMKRNSMVFGEKFQLIYSRFIKIPFGIRIIIGIIMFPMLDDFLRYEKFLIGMRLSREFIYLTIIAVIVIYYGCCAYDIKRLRNDKQYSKESFIGEISQCIKESFIRKSVLFKVIIFSVITTGVSCAILLSFLGIGGPTFMNELIVLFAFLYLIIYFFLIVPCVLKNIGKFNKILQGTKKMTEGDLNFTIDVKEKGALGELANNINNIKDGYDKAVKDEVKSQRFKSELITNVSHDLKTPLTSIINYVKLLQQEGLSEDEIKGYIGVLDRKAERLKVLIEDLFEASKVSSGAVELNIEKLDVVSLLKQALGEFDEKIQKSSLDFRIKLPDKSIYCELDGKKTWRLFENLISNILKYSQKNTRVYIDLQEKDNKAIITMKNIASYEMNFEPDEIFERFKRGDESRTTEGSGLGLAIANSIAELQGGKLDINVDGDLFKSIVELKVIK
ncbi:HAMP domain-containing sensor histidine kinase [Clostridium botulinum]|uniref:histidine kinase n=2 Tax=Clostridium botulinum TaxID=1491 RepID=A0A9Q1V0D6_CLOBO|nr:sensor histidine kinase [Clostridium botulinum]KEI02301.1 histidine kinase [Clostridium botulinum D str. 16868]KEI04574.1 histidine kinase [Clostridium botulinum C/D str. Sp77]KLU75104.1 histidine kinase [Clostridium botulinum V891]KOA76174.1 histidine kinase [Clostridium botulinum]KOA86857.1 histidine kinase [Clostridium botulinum]